MKQTLLAFLRTLDHRATGGITEVCIFQGGDVPTHAGYFDNVEAAAKAVESFDGRGNIFVTLDPVQRDLLARYNNRLVEGSFKRKLKRTKNDEILCKSWLFLDIDAKRPSGISATEDELNAAIDVGEAVLEWLVAIGVPDKAILTAKSGNGVYILIRVPDYKPTSEQSAVLPAFTKYIASLFNTEQVKVDDSVHNAARLCCALGTIKVKGENIPERPHRRSSIDSIGGEAFDANKKQFCEPFDLAALATQILPKEEPKPQPAGYRNAMPAQPEFDIRDYLASFDNRKSTGREFNRFNCPGCGGVQTFYANETTGAYGCFHYNNSTCSKERIRESLGRPIPHPVERMARSAISKIPAPLTVSTATSAVNAPVNKPETQSETVPKPRPERIREVLFDGRITLELTTTKPGRAVLVARNCTEILHRDELSLNKNSDRAKFVKELNQPEEDSSVIHRALLKLADQIDQTPDTTDGADDVFQPQSAATRLVELADGIELIHNADGDGYAVMMIDGHKETWPLKSKGFKRWLQRLYFEQYGKAPGSQAVQDALGVIEGKALYDGPERKIFIRVGESDGKIYLDLADEVWRAVEITAEGWRVLAVPPIEFRRAKGMLPLPIPVAGGNLDDLRPFLNLEKGDLWTLILGSLVMKLHPYGPYNVDVFTGGQGCGKTTRARIVRALIDPSSADTRSAPRELRDLHIAAVNEWLPTFDNLSSIQQWLSDGLCCLSTGGGSRTRELYSDSEEAIFSAKRPIILTSITEVVQQPDLLDRSIIYNLPQFGPGVRKPEKQLWAEFKKAHGGILGALLDAAVCALVNEDKVVINEASRLADFERWAVAAEPMLGLEKGAFRTAYERNRGGANDLALDSCPIAEPIINLARQIAAEPNAIDRFWKGTAKELFDFLLTGKSDEDKRKLKEQGWPKTPSGLSAMLRRLAPNLLIKHVSIEFNIREGKKGSRKILISPLPKLLDDGQEEKGRETPSDIVSPSVVTENKGLTSSEAGSTSLNSDENPRGADGLLPKFRPTTDGPFREADGHPNNHSSLENFESKDVSVSTDGLTMSDGNLQAKSYRNPAANREVLDL